MCLVDKAVNWLVDKATTREVKIALADLVKHRLTDKANLQETK